MGSEQRVEAVLREGRRPGRRGGAQIRKTDLLQNYIPVRVGENFFLNTVSPAKMGVDQMECRNTRFHGRNLEGALPFFFGEKTGTIGDHQAQIAEAGHIHSPKINLIQESVAESEPHAAAAVKR